MPWSSLYPSFVEVGEEEGWAGFGGLLGTYSRRDGWDPPDNASWPFSILH